MSQNLALDCPLGWQIGLPLAVAVLALAWHRLRRGGLRPSSVWILCGLRTVVLLVLVGLLSRPVWVMKDDPSGTVRKSVVLLLDRSESMSIEEDGKSRYSRAVAFTREQLLPALKSAGLTVHGVLFGEESELVSGEQIVTAKPDGKRTNLGGAIARSLAIANDSALGVIALTDGAVNETCDNVHGLTALADARVPFIGIGIGSDRGVQTLTLRRVEGPATAGPNTAFNIAAQLEMENVEAMPAFELVLLRDGRLSQKKSVEAGKGSRFWRETFRVMEKEVGPHRYAVQMLAPVVAGVKCLETQGATTVNIGNEKELRLLYVQGALTWDYKFIGMALRGDPLIKITGLTRTSSKSVFRQNVENAGELLGGFPTTIEELAPFRVVVISNLKPVDLTPPQQELLARFCGELGGGVLMLGGAGTFDASWQGSRLEQMLPVIFSGDRGVQGLDRPFHMQLSDEALAHPVFQVTDDRSSAAIWKLLPTFTHYGRVDSAKAGAQVWAVHQEDRGPAGRRILMATQRYGSGMSAVLCVQNFWRWRLAKDCDPQQFDRFWRQFFRYLGESSRQEVAIHFTGQNLRPGSEVQMVFELQPDPKNAAAGIGKFRVRVEDDEKVIVKEEPVELAPSRPVEMVFRAGKSGVYSVSVLNAQKQVVANSALEIRESNLEFQNTGRNMESLRQWATLSDGMAAKLEDCHSGGELVATLKAKAAQVRRNRVVRHPLGVNVWTLMLTVGCLGAEWFLRKRWGLS